MSFTSPVHTSSHTPKLSRPPLLTMTRRVPPTVQRPCGVQLARASWSRWDNAKQRALPTQTRASAFAIAAVIMSSVSATSATSLPAPMTRRKQALHGSRMMPAGVATWRPER